MASVILGDPLKLRDDFKESPAHHTSYQRTSARDFSV